MKTYQNLNKLNKWNSNLVVTECTLSKTKSPDHLVDYLVILSSQRNPR